MLERLQSAVCPWRPGRYVSILVAAALALGCHSPDAPVSGQLELLVIEGGSRSDSSAKATFVGSLELRGLRDGTLSSIPIEGVSPGSTARRELPAGLYSLAWTRDEGKADEAGGIRTARDLPLVGIIAGQVTTLSVVQPEACSLSQRAALATEPEDLGASQRLVSWR